MRTLTFLTLLVVVLGLSGCMLNLPGAPALLLAGSGDVQTRTYNIADFNSISAGSAVDLEVVRGDDFSLIVTAGADTIDHVRVEKVGSTLKVYVDNPGLFGYRIGTVGVRVAMPRLEELELSGASRAHTDFTSSGGVCVRLSGTSTLNGRLSADHIKFDVSGASRVEGLNGSARTLLVYGTGASEIGLGDYPVNTARIELSSASSAQIRVTNQLNYSLSGGSNLVYAGTAALGTAQTSGGSSASRK